MTQNRKLKLGVIGGGINSAVGYAHFSACNIDGLFEYTAGCFSADPEINAKSGQTYNVTPDRVYNNWRDLLDAEKGQLDALLILTPTPDHFENVSAAIQAGYKVICEKALVSNQHDAEKLRRLVIENNAYLAVTYNYSGYPMVRHLRQMIADNALGTIQHLQLEMPQESFARLNAQGEPLIPQSWRLKDGEVATIHLDLGVHLHHLVYYLLRSTPAELVATQRKYGSFDVIDDVNATINYSAGFSAQLWYSKSAIGHRNGLKLRAFGDKASAEWVQENPEILQLNHANGRRETLDRSSEDLARYSSGIERFKVGHPAGYIEAFANLYKDIHEDILTRKVENLSNSNEVFGVDIALESIQLMHAIKASSDRREWVKLDENV